MYQLELKFGKGLICNRYPFNSPSSKVAKLKSERFIPIEANLFAKYSEKFFEYISNELFQDKSEILSIQKSISDIYWYFNKDNTTSKAMDVTSKIPLKFDVLLPMVLTICPMVLFQLK